MNNLKIFICTSFNKWRYQINSEDFFLTYGCSSIHFFHTIFLKRSPRDNEVETFDNYCHSITVNQKRREIFKIIFTSHYHSTRYRRRIILYLEMAQISHLNVYRASREEYTYSNSFNGHSRQKFLPRQRVQLPTTI